MNLRELEYLAAVAETKNFTEAAKKCFVGQPTLSTQLKKLEDLLEVKLFERNNKRVLLTDVGSMILESAKKILREADHIKEIAEESRDPFAGKLRVGAFPTIASYVLPNYVQKIKKAMPRIKLLLFEEKTEVLIEKLHQGEIDIAILAAPVNEEGFLRKDLFTDEFLLAVPKSHSLSKEEQVRFKELEEHKLLLLTEGHCLREQALDICKTENIGEEDFRATSMETLREMVKAGSGMTLIPRVAVKPDKSIKYLEFTQPKPSRKIAMYWRSISAKQKLIGKVYETIRNAVS